jgi:hypothetical protein
MNVVNNTSSVYKNLYERFSIEGTADNFDLKNDARHKTYSLKFSLKLILSYGM